MTSAKRGILVTGCLTINASGNHLPPALIFPHRNFKQHVIRGAPVGTFGLAAAGGWMNTELFVDVMEHFIKHLGSTKENPTLLVYDNHESHMSCEVIMLARENGVFIVTLPPHTSDQLQPFDLSVNKALKTVYNFAVDSWHLRNSDTPMMIYETAEVFRAAYDKATASSNIKSGFSNLQ